MVKKGNPSVRVNMTLEGDHARLLIDLKDRKVITSFPEGIRLALNKYLETCDCAVLVLKVEGIKIEEN